jgi:hypothetical protein
MTIQSIELEIDLSGSFANLNEVIETKLQQWGEPLRWAITSIDPATNIAQIEAIVIGA